MTPTKFRRRLRHVGIRSCAGIAALLVLASGDAFAIEPGQPAPGFKRPLLGGSTEISLSDYRGKVVYVDFWASWCPPCLSAMPALESLRGEFPKSDFQILAVNLDKKSKKALKTLGKQKVGYPSVADPGGRLPTSYGLETMPTSYLIDRRGIVRYVHEGFRSGDENKLRDEIRRLVEVKR